MCVLVGGALCVCVYVCGGVWQVRVMYTPFIGDEKRDIVEYTSLGTQPAHRQRIHLYIKASLYICIYSSPLSSSPLPIPLANPRLLLLPQASWAARTRC